MTTTIKKYNFKESVKNRVEIVSLEELTEAKPHLVYTPHRTDFYHIFLFEDCTPVHTVDFRPIAIVPNSILFVGEGRVHLFDNKRGYKGKVLIFTEDILNTTKSEHHFLTNSNLFNSVDDNLLFVPSKQLTDQLQIILTQISKEIHQVNDRHSATILKNLLHIFLLLCEREKTVISPQLVDDNDSATVFAFKRLVEAHYTEHLPVSDYAKKLLITEKRLTTATNKVLGKTAKEIISERVVLEAKRLLLHSGNSIKMIAVALGFDDSAYFSRYFKKHSAKSPLEFREQFIN